MDHQRARTALLQAGWTEVLVRRHGDVWRITAKRNGQEHSGADTNPMRLAQEWIERAANG